MIPRSSQASQVHRAAQVAKEEERFRRRIIFSAGFIAITAVAATVGYQVVEKWSLLDSLYMVAITLTTVGFGEVHPMSNAGQVLTLGLVVFGVSGALYAVAAIAEYIAEGHFAEGIRRRRLNRLVSRLSGHYVVCGFGRMGLGIVNELLREGQSVCIVDVDAERCGLAETLGLPIVQGDATEDSSLIAAGLTRARGLVAALDSAFPERLRHTLGEINCAGNQDCGPSRKRLLARQAAQGWGGFLGNPVRCRSSTNDVFIDETACGTGDRNAVR